jgi:hypothetical protein
MKMFSVPNMAHAQEVRSSTPLSKCDTYFQTIQSRKKLPQTLQETLTDSFAKIPVSSFPGVPGGKGNRINHINAFQNYRLMIVKKKKVSSYELNAQKQ